MTFRTLRFLSWVYALALASVVLAPWDARAAEPAADTAATREAPTFAGADLMEAMHPFPSPEVRAWQTGLLRPDRIEHASLAWTLGLGAGLATREPAAAFATPALLGLAKEIADRHGTGFDTVDLLADLLGAAAAGAIVSRWK